MPNILRIPHQISPNETQLSLKRPIAEFRAPSGGTSQRDERPGARWQITVSLPPLRNDGKAAIIEAFIAQAGRGDSHVIMPVNHRRFRGNLDVTEKLLNPKFVQGATNWDAAFETTLAVLGSRLKVTSNVAPNPGGAIQEIAGASLTESYVLIADYRHQNDADPYVQIRDNADLAIATSAANTDEGGRIVQGFTPTTAALDIGLRNTSGIAGAYTIWQQASLRKAPHVNGAGQEGSLIMLAGMEPNVTSAIAEGDYVTIDDYLYVAAEDMDTDASGEGGLFIEPVLHRTPADGAPVIIGEPYMRCRLDTGSYSPTAGVMWTEGVTFTLTEDLTRTS